MITLISKILKLLSIYYLHLIYIYMSQICVFCCFSISLGLILYLLATYLKTHQLDDIQMESRKTTLRDLGISLFSGILA